MIIVLACIFLVASFKWGDWRNWRTYHSTILYFILCDCIYNLLTYEYPLWAYIPNTLPTHLMNNFVVDLVIYPSFTVIYLYRFPKDHFKKQILYVAAWLILAILIEWVFTYEFKLFSYHHGWNLFWSAFLDILIFIYLKLHQEKPVMAYILSLPAILFFLIVFQVPLLGAK